MIQWDIKKELENYYTVMLQRGVELLNETYYQRAFEKFFYCDPGSCPMDTVLLSFVYL
jgi:hypothetical protein